MATNPTLSERAKKAWQKPETIKRHQEGSIRQSAAIKGNSFAKGYKRNPGQLEGDKRRATVHGMCFTKEYSSWKGMRNRVRFNSTYIRKGITVDKRWTKSFEEFYKDMGPMPQDGQRYSLDRINNKGNYEPGNCRWATYRQQILNRTHCPTCTCLEDKL